VEDRHSPNAKALAACQVAGIIYDLFVDSFDEQALNIGLQGLFVEFIAVPVTQPCEVLLRADGALTPACP